jgi:multiple sugar transport system ATP-binding protein
VDAPPVLTDDTRELAQDRADRDVPAGSEAGSATMVGRVSPRTDIREGDRAQLVVDTGRLHFFDLETGLALGDDRTGSEERPEVEAGAEGEA